LIAQAGIHPAFIGRTANFAARPMELEKSRLHFHMRKVSLTDAAVSAAHLFIRLFSVPEMEPAQLPPIPQPANA
jgi:hypothetical protein